MMEKIYRTRLWAMLHDLESVTDVATPSDKTVLLDEFAREFHDDCPLHKIAAPECSDTAETVENGAD